MYLLLHTLDLLHELLIDPLGITIYDLLEILWERGVFEIRVEIFAAQVAQIFGMLWRVIAAYTPGPSLGQPLCIASRVYLFDGILRSRMNVLTLT